MKLTHVVTVLTALSVTAGANAIRQDQTIKAEGSGNIRRDRTDNRLNSFEFVMRRNGSATITFVGSKRWTYQGSWTNTGREDIRFIVETAYGDSRADGSILLRISNGRLDSVDGSGFAKDLDFRVNFDVRQGGYLDGSGNSEISISNSYSGNGRSVIGRDNIVVSTANFRIDRNGKFTINVPREGEISGTWRERSKNVLELTLDRIYDWRNASGSGNLYLTSNGKNVDRVSLSGRNNRDVFSFNFDANGASDTFTMNHAASGDGNLRIGNRSYDLNRATLKLNRDSTFDLSWDGDRRSSAKGTWSRRGNSVNLKFDEGFGDREVNGSGSANIDERNRTFNSLNLSARGRANDYRLNFEAKNVNSGRNPVDPRNQGVDTGIAFMKSLQGLGTWTYDNTRQDLKTLNVSVKRDGTFSIGVNVGQTTQLLSGTYTKRGNALAVNIDGGMGKETRGTGTITLSSGENSWTAVSVTGSWSGHRFVLDFAIR